jgi:hypothetical protein
MSTALHINHQLNLDEVIRRMEYWALQGNTSVVLMLVHCIERDKHNLCFDTEPRGANL